MEWFASIHLQVITATGIESSLMSLQPTDNRIFTISGQLIETSSQLRPGIYIQNGRKFIIK